MSLRLGINYLTLDLTPICDPYSDPYSTSPSIRFVVMTNVAKQQACFRLVNDQSYSAVNANRPKVRISRLLKLMKLHSGLSRIQLQVERGSLIGFLLVAGQLREAICEGVGYPEFHDLKGGVCTKTA